MVDRTVNLQLETQRVPGPTWLRLVVGYGIIWVTLGLFVALALTTPAFFTAANLRNILDQQSSLLIGASVATVTMIAGGFDISLSAIAIASALTALRVENASGSIAWGLAAGLTAGLVFGMVNALIVTRLKVNSFIATLATSFIYFGFAYIISERSIMRPVNAGFSDISRTKWLGLTSATYIAVVVVLATAFTLSRTRFGRYVYAAGGNSEAARLAGVRVGRILGATFVLGGLAAALAGILSTAKTISAQPSDSFAFVFSVIAAIVVGGTSIAGGEGAVWRTVLGAFFIAFMTNGFNLHQVDPVYQRVVQGTVILGAVAIDAWSRSRRS